MHAGGRFRGPGAPPAALADPRYLDADDLICAIPHTTCVLMRFWNPERRARNATSKAARRVTSIALAWLKRTLGLGSIIQQISEDDA